MSFEGWCLLLGGLLIVIAALGSLLARLPVTAAMVYFGAGVILGPLGLGWVQLDPVNQSALLERLAEVAVIVSLFTAGLKLRVPLRDRQWRGPAQLAFVSMAITVGLIALIGVYLLDLPWGAAVLLGGVLAPTDPVLASTVQVRRAGDRDPVRFALTGEAGLNDGTAFPFVMLGLGLLGLHEIGSLGGKWLAVDVLWAISGGLAIGAGYGTAVGRFILHLRRTHQEALGRDEFLALGLIGASYGLALMAHTYGFLAVFAAGLALRAMERRAGGDAVPEELLDDPTAAENAAVHPQTAPAHLTETVLGFNEQMERLIEVALVLTVGLMLTPNAFTGGALVLAGLLFFVVRPVAVWVGAAGSGLAGPERPVVSWLGVRGIGSIYYLMHALEHGVPEELARPLCALTLVTVAGSIVLHGITSTPVMGWYERRTGGNS